MNQANRIPLFTVHYHESTKHHFNRFAASLGYLDWATQPDPFRRFDGAPLLMLSREPLGAPVPYGALFDGSAPPAVITDDAVAELLRCSMGLSAWKQFRQSRWALRVNPSSGNLHPTEAYVVRDGRVAHYAPREHALEQRVDAGHGAWTTFSGARSGFLVALTSIHWREAWKYGERAFRYCQHDAGHAIGALRFAAAMLGWRVALLPRWSSEDIASVTGIDRDADYREAEREEADCIAVVTPGDTRPWQAADVSALVDVVRSAGWQGTPNRLSAGRVDWPAIDRVAEATRYPGSGIRDQGSGIRDPGPTAPAPIRGAVPPQPRSRIRRSESPADPGSQIPDPGSPPAARQILLHRRSAVAFDARSSLPRATFVSMLQRVNPGAPPWDAIDWPPHVHLLLFVHRVEGLTPGVYAYLRDPAVKAEWRAAMRPDFLWEPVANDSNHSNDSNDSNDRLFLLLPLDVSSPAARVSCDQDIAADGFFSLGMIARFEASLAERGEWFYRHLFWECGLIGQVLYLEAEAAGARGTGIGCFYDDAVHDLAGLSGNAWQSLYHFSMGVPVEDTRLTTEPGYRWEVTTITKAGQEDAVPSEAEPGRSEAEPR